jgi:hypothetical protein
MDVSGGILANLDAGNPCRHDEDLHVHVSVGGRKLMKHSSFVVKFWFRSDWKKLG